MKGQLYAFASIDTENTYVLRIYHEKGIYHCFASPESFPLGNTPPYDSEGMVPYMFP